MYCQWGHHPLVECDYAIASLKFYVNLSVSQEILPIAFRLGEKVIGNCVEKLKPAFVEFVKPSDVPLNEYSKIVDVKVQVILMVDLSIGC